MAGGLVTLVNPNKIHPGVAPYALDILTTHLERAGFDVDVVDLTYRRDEWLAVLQEYFSVASPMLVGVTVRNTDTNSSQDQIVFLPEHREIIQALKELTHAPIVTGGAAFGTMPFGLVRYFGVRYAVPGPGEHVLVELAQRLAEGRAPDDVEGLIIHGDDGHIRQIPQAQPHERVVELRGTPVFNQTRPTAATPSYARRSGRTNRVDNGVYYRRGGLGSILAKNGCSFFCAHCCEFYAKGRQMSVRTLPDVCDELEMLTGQGIAHVHTTDSEFNFKINNTKALLREVVRRKSDDPSSPLHSLKLWVYAQPVPFDEELADLLVAAGLGGVNFGTDHVCDEILRPWKIAAPGGPPYYSFEDARRANDWLMERGALTCHEFLLGMPGETVDTLKRCIDGALSLRSHAFGLTLGIRVFPYQPLALQLAEECDGVRTVPGLQSNTAVRPIVLKPLDKCTDRAEYELQFMFDEDGRVRPVFYFSPELPEPPEVVRDPAGRRDATMRFIHDYIPEGEHARIMIQPVAGTRRRSSTQVDPPLLVALFELGYRGSAWSWWPELERIAGEARARGML